WDQDFSWDGLANKNIYNSGQTLQNYWWDEREDLIELAKKKWTRFHLPFHDKDGNPSPRHEFTTDQIAQWQLGIINRLTIASQTRKEVAQLSGVIFPENFRPTNKTATSPHGDLRICANWAQFGENADFNNVTFRENANFSNAYFGVEVVFQQAQFHHIAIFENTKFGSNTRFARAKFESDANFKNAEFADTANFDLVRFNKETNFELTQFGDHTNFEKAQFKNKTIFTHATFGKNVRFSSATFLKNSSFNHAKFGKDAHFDYAVFGPFASFDEAEFHGTCIFGMAVDQKDIPEAYDLSFKEVKFFGDVHFTNRVFQPNTNFTKANFRGLAEFHGCTFHQDTSFAEATFELPKKADTTERAEKYQRAFRTLRQLMEENGAFTETFKFARLEMQAKQRRAGSNDISSWERFQSRLFGTFADYGQSAERPLLWLIIFFFLAAGAYNWIASDGILFGAALATALLYGLFVNRWQNMPRLLIIGLVALPILATITYTWIAGDWRDAGSAAAMAFQYSLPPVSIFASQFFYDEIDPIFINALLDNQLCTRVVIFSHGISSLALVFFLLLALKRRFQIR
ncbi:MAG: pentapeptide repeat-containing protein, partial [Robiginitomaculum sp.]|nr:pentapeptide repeat-containing protein [Robiginitomaculum sp.]